MRVVGDEEFVENEKKASKVGLEEDDPAALWLKDNDPNLQEDPDGT